MTDRIADAAALMRQKFNGKKVTVLLPNGRTLMGVIADKEDLGASNYVEFLTSGEVILLNCTQIVAVGETRDGSGILEYKPDHEHLPAR